MPAWLLATAIAYAAPADPALSDAPGIGVRLSGELLQDANIAAGYGSGSLSVEGLLSVPLGPLEFGAEAGYRRIGGELVDGTTPTGESSWISYAPISLTLGARLPAGSGALYAHAGPSLVIWEEQVPTDPVAGTGSSGGKFGFLVAGGAAIPLPVLRSLHDPDGGPSGLELQVDLGYRHTLPRVTGCLIEAPCGLRFSAVKAGVGVVLRL